MKSRNIWHLSTCYLLLNTDSTLHSHCLSNRHHWTFVGPAIPADSPLEVHWSPLESIGHDWILLLVQAKSSESPLKPLRRSKKWLDWLCSFKINHNEDGTAALVSRRQTPIQVNFVDLYGSRVYVVCFISRPSNRVRKLLCNLRTLKPRRVNISPVPSLSTRHSTTFE